MTLHQVINEVLLDLGRPMTTNELANVINFRHSYTKRDGSPVDAFQIHGRTKNYPNLFSRSGSFVGLVEWDGRSSGGA